MGSPKVINPIQMADDKKSIKNIFKKPFQALFHNKSKKEKTKEKHEPIEAPKDIKPKEINVTPVTVLLENFQKLAIEKEKSKREEDNDNEENEFENFQFKTIQEDNRSSRIDSHSSEDSGFADNRSLAVDTDDENDEKLDEKLVESFKDLNVEEKQEKKKKIQVVVVARGPIRHNSEINRNHAHPYAQEQAEASFRQINQINKQTLSGGQVKVRPNECSENIPVDTSIYAEQNVDTDNYPDIVSLLEGIDTAVKTFAQNSHEEKMNCWQDAQDFVQKSTQECCNKAVVADDILSDFGTQVGRDNPQISVPPIISCPSPNAIEMFSSADHAFDYEFDLNIDGASELLVHNFPTPPRSVNVPSPISDSRSPYPPNSEFTPSPAVSSSPFYNSDYEKYQDISPFYEYPSCIELDVDEKKREKSTMTMKQFKDLQKELANEFSKKECCQINRKSCKDVFQEHLQKLGVDERKSLCFKVANLDLDSAYGVLRYILLNLSRSDKDESLHLVLFSLIAEKVLGVKPELFVDDFGLSLLRLAVLRAYNKPILTRYIVQCIRTVTRTDTYKPAKDHVFSELDALGDNLLIACARAGDACADVMAELVRREENDIPLFNVHHANCDGHTALHVACSAHGERTPRTHVVHVLLRHARADIWHGDMKGGDTALHLAVNSANCELNIVMILFQQLDRKMWKKLAHAQNRSSITPLEYARSAMKSTSRQNYPAEVLEFLKKCR